MAHFDASELLGFANGASVTSWSSLVADPDLVLSPQAGTAPTYQTNSIPISGKPGVLFSGVSRLGGVLSAGTFPATATFIFVVKNPANDGNIKWMVTSNGYEVASKWNNADRWVFGQNQFSFIEFTEAGLTSQFCTWVHGYQAIGAFVRANGIQKVTGNHGTAAHNQLYMGAFDGGNSGFTMYELAVYDRVLTTTEIEEVEAYLDAKWLQEAVAEPTFVAQAQGQFVFLSIDAPGAESVTITRRTFDNAEIRVRGIVNAPIVSDGFVGYDYEAPQGRDLTYTAYVTYPDDEVITLFDDAGIVDYGGDYIMPVGRWEFGMTLFVEWDGISGKEHSMIQDTVPVLGRKGPVSVSWGRLMPRGSISFLTMEDFDRRNFLRVIEYPVIMFVARSGFGYDDPVFLSLEVVTEERTIGYGGESSRRWICDVQEVDRPPATYVLPVLANSWQSVFDAYADWQAVKDTQSSWYQIAGYP
jgi:hypothetical protein